MAVILDNTGTFTGRLCVPSGFHPVPQWNPVPAIHTVQYSTVHTLIDNRWHNRTVRSSELLRMGESGDPTYTTFADGSVKVCKSIGVFFVLMHFF
jgi:hypothetical protein